MNVTCLFTEQGKVRLVGGEAQHDQICIQAIQAMPGVGIITRLALRVSDVLHDFVFALTWRL